MKLRRLQHTLIAVAVITLAASLADYVLMVVIQGNPAMYTPLNTVLICLVVGFPISFFMISQRHDIIEGREALAAARDAAEQANHAKSAFLANMSHEIRTPLNGVLGMVQAMDADPLSPTQRERLLVVRRSGETLLAVLNDILDFSKIEAGRLELEIVEFDLEELLGSIHDTFSPLARQKGLALEQAVADAARGRYRGDPTRIRQILCNLVSNALKFTEQGGVRITVGQDGGSLLIEVADTGVGVEPEILAVLFEKFVQADASTTRRFGGTGLGLAISRELAELMGGAIRAESRPGEGSTFTAALPLAYVGESLDPAPCEPQAPLLAPGEPGLRVLAAEDNAVNQLVLQTLLRQLGLDPVLVGDGREALDAFERQSWDLILMDVQMPGMDGLSAAREIRRREAAEGRAPVPIIALTADVMAHQVAAYAEAGMDGFVGKPIDLRLLLEAVEDALSVPRRADAPG